MTNWVNNTTPAINAANLNKMERGILDAASQSQGVITFSTRTEINSLINIQGAIQYSDGTDYSSSSYSRTDYIPVSKGDILLFSGVKNYALFTTVAFYNTSKTYNQSKSLAGAGDSNYQYARIQFDSDGFIRIVCKDSELSNYAVFRLINKMGNAISEDIDSASLKTFLDNGQFFAFTDEDKWINGSTNNSIQISPTPYRLTTLSTIVFTEDTVLYIKTGFRIYTYYVNANDERIGSVAWTTDALRIPANSRCRFIIARVTENTSEHMAISEIYNITADIGILKKMNELPIYWRNYLDTKYPTLWEKDTEIGSGGDSFVFITDFHYERNLLNSPQVIKDIVKKTAVKTVVCGGDIIDLQSTKEKAVEILEDFQSRMYGLNIHNIVGNHDNNNFDNSQSGEALSKGEYYGIMFKPMEKYVNTNGELYYCIDNDSQKIRYICLAIDCYDAVSGTQKDWLKARLLEKDSDWTILVMQHKIWGASGEIATVAQQTINAINEVYSDMEAKFIGILAGHWHKDHSETESVNGYNLIVLNCDVLNTSYSGYTRTAGTYSEQSFDVIYIDKTNETMYAVRIGAGDTVVGSGTGIQSWSY